MAVRIRGFGGPVVWLLRKYCSNFTSKVMLSVAAKKYKKSTNAYINWFLKQETIPLPINVMVETINRCNGECAFCPANKNAEKRPFKKMTDEMFQRILEQLEDMNWCGKLFLCVNNEPFADVRILKFAKEAKDVLNCEIVLISNGTLIDEAKLMGMKGIINQLIVNDYSTFYRLSPNHKYIYKYLKSNRSANSAMDVVINRRYAQEILATRAGTAPNKPQKNNGVNTPCIYPFTDFIIFPDGEVGLCCNDCEETTHFGNITESTIAEIWNNKNFNAVRKAMLKGRDKWEFCKNCDVVDAGERESTIKHMGVI